MIGNGQIQMIVWIVKTRFVELIANWTATKLKICQNKQKIVVFRMKNGGGGDEERMLTPSECGRK